jgi:tryptophan halogenase
MVKDLNVPFGFERSVKIMEKTLLPERFLIGVESKGMSPEQQENVLDICRHIDMPEDYLEHFREELPQADVVLFGFEKNEKQRFYKVYLEYTERIRDAFDEKAAIPHPVLINTGFKWDVSNNARKVLTYYNCFPTLVLKEMAARAAGVFHGPPGTSPYRIVEDILDLAANRAGPSDFLYIEATEDENPRQSFDINVYQSGLRIAELYPRLLDIIKYFEVSSESFYRTYEVAKTMFLGHVAGGVDREGRDFLTIYFSEKENRRRRIERSLGGEGTNRQ